MTAPRSRAADLRRFIPSCLLTCRSRGCASTERRGSSATTRRQVSPDPSGRARDPVPVARPCHLLSQRTAGSLPSAWDLLESHRTVLMERTGRRLCDAQRGDTIAGRARARDLPARDPDECGEFGGVRRRETVDEIGPRRAGRRRHARLDGAERRARPQPTDDAVARAEQLGPDVVAERIVARRRSGRRTVRPSCAGSPRPCRRRRTSRRPESPGRPRRHRPPPPRGRSASAGYRSRGWKSRGKCRPTPGCTTRAAAPGRDRRGGRA